MKVHGELTEHGEVLPHPNVVDERDEMARRFIIRASAPWKDMPPRKRSEEPLSGTRGFDWSSRSKLLVWWKGILVRR